MMMNIVDIYVAVMPDNGDFFVVGCQDYGGKTQQIFPRLPFLSFSFLFLGGGVGVVICSGTPV